MPSASGNKLEKQSSTSSVHSGGGSGPGGGGHTPTDAAAPADKSLAGGVVASAEAAANSATVAAKEKSNGGGSAAEIANLSPPMKQTIVTIEHKIRNLEKRKTKLESYRAIQSSGKELSADQKAAVAKYEAVMATLDFARDFSKQMLQFAREAEKELKKQARKDIAARTQAETVKLREMLIMQNVLLSLSFENIREDFLAGKNGAVQLKEEELALLSKFSSDTALRRPESTEDPAFASVAQKVAEHFSMTIDGRPKQYMDSTYENLRRLFHRIQESEYLDKIYMSAPEPVEAEEEFAADTGEEAFEDAVFDDGAAEQPSLPDADLEQQQMMLPGGAGGDAALPMATAEQLELTSSGQGQQGQGMPFQAVMQGGPVVAAAGVVPNYQPRQSGATTPVQMAMFTAQQPPPPQLHQVPPGGLIAVQPQMVAAAAPPPPHQQQPQQQQQRPLMTSPDGVAQQQQQQQHLPPGHFPATTVRAVEQTFFKEHQQQQLQRQQRFLQKMRPLAEIIEGSGFYFLQDSELDSPDISSAGGPAPPAMIFDQQQQQQQQPQEQALLVGNLPQAPIQSQTFTNQSFPPLQPPSPGVAAGSGSSNAPSPMFQQQQQQQQQQLFSPAAQMMAAPELPPTNPTAAQQPLLLNEAQQQQQQQQPPLMMMARMGGPPAQRITPQQQQQQQQQQTSPQAPLGHVTPTNVVFGAFDGSLSYEHQLAGGAPLKPALSDGMEPKAEVFGEDSPAANEWESSLKHAPRSGAALAQSTNVAATAALANVLKPGAASLEGSNAKWSGEVDAIAQGPAVGGNNNNNGGGGSSAGAQPRKSDWSHVTSSGGGGGSGGYGDGPEANHWSSQASPQDNGTGGGGGGGGYGRGSRGPNTYQRRDRGDERREDRGRGGGFRGRSNYGNSGSQQNGGGRGGGSNGMYFRNNNDNANNSYYQNGSGYGGGGGAKEGGGGSRYDGGGGGNYRGQRGNVRGGGGPPTRGMGRNNNNSSSGGSGGTSSYMNPRQSNRIPMGMENKN